MSGDSIYVAGLPLDVTEQELVQHFGQIGVVKTNSQTGQPSIWIYKDSQTGLPRGDAVIFYQDPYTAAASVHWFHQKPMRGSIVHVSLVGGTPLTGAAYVSAPQPSMETGQQVMDAQGMGYHHVGEYDSASQMYVQPGYASNTSVASGFAHPSTHTVDASTTNQGAGRGQPQRGGDAPRGRGRKIVAAPQGPARLFGPDDWPCPSCGNTNWARRPRCNLCGAPKPGTLDMKREGQAGGFKELDEEEIEEARRRRKALEEADDGELYDDYGRIKKKYRNIVDKATREEAALARLRGRYDPSPSGQELAALFKSDDVVEEDQKEKTEQDDEEKKEDKDDPPKELGEREDDQKKESDAVKEMEREADKDAHRHRPISPNRQPRRESRRGSVSPKQRSRRRSISPRYRSRRQYSPYRERESDRSRRTSSYRRSKDQEDRYRYRR